MQIQFPLGEKTAIAQSVQTSGTQHASLAVPAIPNEQKPVRLEKIAAAAIRMAISIPGVYREIKDSRLGPIIKLGPRASALDSADVDRWIATRMEEAKQRAAGKKGGTQ